MSSRHIDDLLIVVHDRALPPSDVDWEHHVRWCKALLAEYGRLKVLVIAGEHAPTAKQRSTYNREINADAVRVAVLMSGSRHLLAIIKVFSWFIRSIKAFGEGDLDLALEYLGVAHSQEIVDTIAEFGGGRRPIREVSRA